MKIRWWASQGALSMGSIKHRNNKKITGRLQNKIIQEFLKGEINISN